MNATARLDRWLCEEHPGREMGHDGCPGAGVPAYDYEDLPARPCILCGRPTRDLMPVLPARPTYDVSVCLTPCAAIYGQAIDHALTLTDKLK